ncbi:GNAT family N-acetyltransferase [Denitromonas sp.]|uniref:GNAT family N-acetyltransferase n=1 Tax=Denitromonas sp. TaxID=2734609 RepID=UPI002AFF40AE|nr:GNAT family N-acetyltransferase [Denitromonas sp.]
MGHTSLEMVRLAPQWQGGLLQFLNDLKESGDDVFFSPHPTDEDSIRRIASFDGKDLYYLLVEKNRVLGYGMLRGWDEGYQIPSLGLAIHPTARGLGLGKMLMDFLHLLASRRGAGKVRLRVRANNEKAICLYKSLGYVFEKEISQSDFLVGFKGIERK